MTAAIMSQTRHGPVGVPQTSGAIFLRGLNISPRAGRERLESAADSYGRRCGVQSSWEDMPTLLAEAWGEEPPNNGGGRERKNPKPQCKRQNHRRVGRGVGVC